MGWPAGRKHAPETKEKMLRAQQRNAELMRRAKAMEVEEKLAAARAEAAKAERELAALKAAAGRGEE